MTGLMIDEVDIHEELLGFADRVRERSRVFDLVRHPRFELRLL